MEKLKEYKKTRIITSIVILLPIIIGVMLWDKLPNEIATHFGSNGEPDGWSSKFFAVIGLPVFLVFIHILCFAATVADPKKNRIGDKIFKLILWICPAVSWFGALSIYGHESGWGWNVETMAHLLLGIMFIFIGNYLPKCRQNYTVGIKIPWTLHDEENWNRTHRLAGWLWMVGGFLFVISAFINVGGMASTLIITFVMVLVPVIYSFVYYVKHK